MTAPSARTVSPRSVLARHWPYLALLILGCAYLLALSLLHHRALGTGYDLGIYDQVVWNLAHGRAFMTTLVYETNGYYDHFEPVLALLAPLYWLWSDARVLLIVQAVALNLGSLPIYLYARRRLSGWKYGSLVVLVIVAAYLAYPALHNANLNDFHEVSLLPPLLGFALYGLLTGKPRILFPFLALCLLVKEDFSVTALAIGVYLMVLRPPGFTRRQGAWLAAAAIAWMLLVLYLLYPTVTRGMPYPFVGRRYPWLGDSPESAFKVLFTQPWIMLPYLVQLPKLLFVLRLMGPLLFLPVLGWPVNLLALPVLVYLMLSNYEPQWSVQSYYNPPLLPFLFFGLIAAFERIRRWLSTPRRASGWSEIALALLVTVSVAVSYYLDGPGPGSRGFRADRFGATPRAEAADSLIAEIPPQASVSTEWNLVPQLSQRERIYTVLARPQTPTDYLLLEESAGAESSPLYPYAAPPGDPPVYHDYREISRSGPFRLLAHDAAIAMTRLQEPDPLPRPVSLRAYKWLGQAGAMPQVRPGETARLMLAWHRTGKMAARYKFFVHLLSDGSPAAANGLPNALTASDHEPGDGRFPTTLWATWTMPPVVLDEQRLEIPADAPPGIYFAWAGVYDPVTMERVELGGSGKSLLLVGPIEVTSP